MNIFEGEKKNNKRIKKLCGFQFKLLLHALTKFPNAKRVVYSTCSVLAEENEKIVEDVLTKLNESTPDDEGNENFLNFNLVEPLKDVWIRRGSDRYPHGKYCIFSDPEHDLTNGFFIAVFERTVNG